MLTFVLHAWSSWKNAKAVALLATAALAAGIGSATAIYTVVNTVLFQPVRWRDGERYVSLFGSANVGSSSKFQWMSNSWLDLLDYQQRTHSFDAFGIYLPREFVLTAPGEPQHLEGVEVTPSFAASLGVTPIAGRWFGEEAAERGGANLAVISSGLWKRLGGDTGIIGQTLRLDGHDYNVTGVMPPWFRLPIGYVDGGELRADVWVPLNPQGGQRDRSFSGYFCYARLRPGVTLAQANADVKRVAAEIAQEHPVEHRHYSALVVSVVESVVRGIRPALLMLLGAAGALLAISCANVAGLLLARSVTRTRETAIRVALGATGRQLAIQYFVEGLLVAVAGAACGVAVSAVLLRIVLSMALDYLPRADGIGINWMALLFAFGAAILSSVLFSLAPLWQALRTLPNEALSDGVRASAPGRTRRLSRSLVVAEIALAFTLLSVGALMTTHLNGLLRTPSGFVTGNLLTFSLNTSSAEYSSAESLASYQKRLLEAIQQIPGVGGAAAVDHLPLEGCCYVTGMFPEGEAAAERATHEVNLITVSPHYFQTMGIPLREGRYLDERDDGKSDILGIVVDEAAAKQYWPGRDALGAYARLGGENGTRAVVEGIVGNVRNRGLGEETEAEIYLPSAVVHMDPMHFLVRSQLPAFTLLPEIRQAVRRVNPSQPLYDAQPMQTIVLGSVTAERLESLLSGFFSMAALLMAVLGVYGVVSYTVRHQTVEIGTRMALGAGGRDVLGMVLGDGLRMAVYGIVLGAVAVAALAFLLKSQIFGVRVDDPQPFLAAAAIAGSFCVLACFFPAWRATLVSPMVAIRDDPGSLWRSARAGAQRIAKRMTELVHRTPEGSRVSESELMTDFIDSSRHAESFRQAIQFALDSLREAIQSESALLLEKDDTAKVYRLVACSPEGRANGLILPANGVLTGRLRGYPFPLPLPQSFMESWRRWAAAKRPKHAAEIETLQSTGADLVVAVPAKDGIAGLLLIGRASGRREYSAAEKGALRNCAAQFALMLENARLTHRMVAQEKLRRDLQLATEVQKRLFPDKPPATAAVTLAGMSIPARSVGGDYYDFLDLGKGRIGIALADVAGKGVAAALIMSVVQASLRVLSTEENASLAELAAKMNRFLHRSTGSNGYATFFYGEIDESKGRLRYVNAGHNPPCLLRCTRDLAIEELPAGGTVIGLFPRSSYEESAVDLEPGDVLVAFTDGVPEALNPQEEEFGEERLKDLLRRVVHLDVSEMASQIASEMKRWIDTADQYDDLTFILMKVNAKAAPG